MKSLAAELASVLSEQAALYEEILSLTIDEGEALAGRKPDQIHLIVRRKETLLLRVKTLDESRRLVCSRIAAGYGLASPSLTVSEILARMGEPPEAGALSQAREKLKACVAELRERNEANSRICENGLEVVRRIVQSLSAATAPASAAKRNSPWAAYGVAPRAQVQQIPPAGR